MDPDHFLSLLKSRVINTNDLDQVDEKKMDLAGWRPFVHEECANFVAFAHNSQCDPNAAGCDCLQDHIYYYVANKEREHRKQVIDDIRRMFPTYSRDLIKATVKQIPIQINALYAILKAISDTSNGCTCPAYELPHLKSDIPVEVNYQFDDLPEEALFNEIEALGAEVVIDLGIHQDRNQEEEGNLVPLEDMVNRNVLTLNEAGPSREDKENDSTRSMNVKQEIKFTTKDTTLATVQLPGNYVVHNGPNKSPKKRCNGSSLSLSHCGPPRKKISNSAPIIVQDDINPVLHRKLVTTLTEMFSDCQIPFVENLCKGKEFSPEVVDALTEHLLTQDYPKREEEDMINFDEQLEIMMGVLPDADPEFLSSELAGISNSNELRALMSTLFETRDYPKLADAQKKRSMCAQIRQYTTDFNAEEFLKVIPDPATYFDAKTFRSGFVVSRHVSYDHMYSFLRNHFCWISVKQISLVLKQSETLMAAVARLDRCMIDNTNIIRHKRKSIGLTGSDDIPLLQLFAYIEHKPVIEETMKSLNLRAVDRKRDAIANMEVNTCGCCFDDEVMPEDSYLCANGCLACKECIRRSVEIQFAENQLQFPCLSSCGAHFSLETLQACLSPKLFCKIVKRKQLEEVKAAGIEDLEICPFCDFAAIPAATDKIFKCYNQECMKETCRLCKEPSHIPLRCDEVEKDQDVKQRVFIENKMTEALMRTCHKCDLKYIKSDGCNKMTCYCRATLCYICGAKDVDYKHFNGQGANEPGKCPLFSNTALLHEQAAIQGGLQAKKELGISSLKVDPLADADKRIDKAIEDYKNLPGAEH